MDNTTIIEKWMTAFDDIPFQQELQTYRNTIETLIKEYITKIKEDKSIMMFDSLESRIKSSESFLQKLSRNNYVSTWELQKTDHLNREYIKKNLSDVIGFRISCYFKEDEIKIYQKFLENPIENVVFDPNTNTKQKNGHDLYKIEGIYNDSCRFEVQIKSLVHNIWGEVEHRTIYKTRAYDFNISNRINITEDSYNILTATDNQLNSLFLMDYNTDKLIKGLFYEFTKEILIKKYKTDILGKAYNQFFSIFYDPYKEYIQQYVAHQILKTNYTQYVINSDSINPDIISFKEKLLNKYLDYDFDLVKSILEIIISYDNDDVFFGFIYFLLGPKPDTELYDDLEDFSDEDNDLEPKDTHNNIDDNIKVIFEKLHDLDFNEVK